MFNLLVDAGFFAGGVVVSTIVFRYSPALQVKLTADVSALEAKIAAWKAKL